MKTILPEEQESEVYKKITKPVYVDVPVTPKLIMRTTYPFLELNKILNAVRKGKSMTGRKWMNLY